MEQIYDKYHESVYRLAYAYTKNRADAEDLTSEVFLKRFTCGKSFDSESHETAWIMRVTINLAKDLLRSFRYRFTVPLEDANIIFESPEESEVWHAVMNLPAKYRSVIHLYYYEGYSVTEIAKMNGKSETAIQTICIFEIQRHLKLFGLVAAAEEKQNGAYYCAVEKELFHSS